MKALLKRHIGSNWRQSKITPAQKINLGYLYENGLGVEKDLAKALNLYREASGFTDGSLEYVSSLDLENREAARIRKNSRENLMFGLEQQLKTQKEQLERQRTKIDTQSRTIKSLQSEIFEKNTLKKVPDQASENGHLSSIRKLESELEQRNSEFSQQEIKLALLQSELDATQKEYEAISKLQMQIDALGTPSIEIIDPPLRLGKKGSLLTINADAVEDMIGKVSPVNSIFALRINGKEHEYSENGLFRYPLPNPTHKSVDLLAISQSGEKSQLSIEIQRKVAKAQETSKTGEIGAFNDLQAVNREFDFGNYHALLIGNERYPLHDDLPTSVADVDAIGSLLSGKYGFKTNTLKNATRSEIISAFDKLRSTLTAEDNLVVYYAGISIFEKNSNGYWLPVDADPKSSNSWIAHRAITDLIDSMAAKHVLLISNSRFSGLLSRSSIARALPEKPAEQKLKWQKAVSKSRVRTVLSTEASRPDADKKQYSQLADALMKVLGENKEILEAYELFIGIQQGMNSDGSPNGESNSAYYYSPMKHAGHEAGEFLFVPDLL